MSGRRLLAVSHTGLFSGAERVLVHYLEAAREAGWQVRCASPDGTLRDALVERAIPVVRLPELKLGDGPRPVAASAMVARWLPAARTLHAASRQADRVLANGLLALPALRLARPPVPVCYLIHDVVVRKDLQLMVRLGAPTVDLGIAVSDAAGALARQCGIPVVVVRNGTRWPVEPTDDVPTLPPIVGINAMVTPWKGHAVLLDAMAHVPGAVLEVMGGHFPKDAGHVTAMQRRADQPDLRGRVRFLGHQSDPLATMRRWTVAVNASVDPEAAPLSVLDAMSIGLPVIATDHGGSPEVLGDGGVLVPPRHAEAMASAVRTLLADPAARARMGAAARRAVSEQYTLAQTTRRFLDVLDGATPR